MKILFILIPGIITLLGCGIFIYSFIFKEFELSDLKDINFYNMLFILICFIISGISTIIFYFS